jgi:T3SS negative regulator,GrlR
MKCDVDDRAISGARDCSARAPAIRCNSSNLQPPGCTLREGLYKVEFHTVHGTGTGVIYASSGKLRGGNSGFAFIGSYTGKGEEIHVKVSTQRHHDDPALKPLFGTDMITLTLKGTADGDMVDFEGAALQLPGVAFKAVLTRIGD